MIYFNQPLLIFFKTISKYSELNGILKYKILPKPYILLIWEILYNDKIISY